MGQQQLLLLILGALIVLIAVAVGISQFSAHSTESNKDGVMSSLQSMSTNAFQFKIRPSSQGGGGNSYLNYTLPSKLTADENGNYALGTVSSNSIQFIGTSAVNTAWTATCTADDTGHTVVTFNGW